VKAKNFIKSKNKILKKMKHLIIYLSLFVLVFQSLKAQCNISSSSGSYGLGLCGPFTIQGGLNNGLGLYGQCGNYSFLSPFTEDNNTVATNSTFQNEIAVYPIPSTGIIHIENLKNSDFIMIHNLLGEVVFQLKKSNSNEVVDLSNFPSGIYIIKIGQKGFTKKIIIQSN
jgi:hypothetical protein